MPKVCELLDSLCERGVSAREACLNGGRELCLVEAAEGQEGGVPVKEGTCLWAWTALDTQWLHCRGHRCSDLGAYGSQATTGWGHRLEEQT